LRFVCIRQLSALRSATTRELLWGLREVAREVRRWRARAVAIPDSVLRAAALESLTHKRASTDGAALFWTLPARRSPNLLRLLVAFEVMADFLDSASERCAYAGTACERAAREGEVGGLSATGVHVGTASGVHLHLALSEALDPGAPVSAHYRHHPWREDGGYLRALLDACRGRCARLPSFERVRAPAIRAATLAQVLGLNHEPDSAARDAALGEWARREARGWGELEWFESAAAASGWLTVLALLALAAGGGVEERRVNDTCTAYLPWISLTGTMLDSYADRAQDAACGEHSYIDHYPGAEEGVERLGELVREAAQRARSLPDGARHMVIVACMVAMYLSKDSVRTPELRASTRRLACACGWLARALLPVLRAWRVAYAQRDE
jgi:tetraprenyl-beta-curcumene synthase